jgi:hypothetical protein
MMNQCRDRQQIEGNTAANAMAANATARLTTAW